MWEPQTLYPQGDLFARKPQIPENSGHPRRVPKFQGNAGNVDPTNKFKEKVLLTCLEFAKTKN